MWISQLIQNTFVYPDALIRQSLPITRAIFRVTRGLHILNLLNSKFIYMLCVIYYLQDKPGIFVFL